MLATMCYGIHRKFFKQLPIFFKYSVSIENIFNVMKLLDKMMAFHWKCLKETPIFQKNWFNIGDICNETSGLQKCFSFHWK